MKIKKADAEFITIQLEEVLRKIQLRKKPISPKSARLATLLQLFDIDTLDQLRYGWKLFSTNKYDRISVREVRGIIEDLKSMETI